MALTAPSTDPPRSYTVLLPPGWQRLPVGQGGHEAIRAVLDHTFRNVPPDTAGPFRCELEKVLLAQLEQARRQHGLDLYLPVGGLRGRPVAASFIVSHLPPANLSGDADEVAVQVMTELADGDARSAAEPVNVAGMPALRTDRLAAPELRPPFGVERTSRRVHYVVPVPEGGGFLVVAFSTVASEPSTDADGRPEPLLSDALVDLFDAVMTTLRWRHA